MNTNKKIFLFSLTLLSPLMVTEKTFAAASADGSVSEKEAALQRLRLLLNPDFEYKEPRPSGSDFRKKKEFVLKTYKSLGLDVTSPNFRKERTTAIIDAIKACLSLGIPMQDIGATGSFIREEIPVLLLMRKNGYKPSLHDIFDYGHK